MSFKIVPSGNRSGVTLVSLAVLVDLGLIDLGAEASGHARVPHHRPERYRPGTLGRRRHTVGGFTVAFMTQRFTTPSTLRTDQQAPINRMIRHALAIVAMKRQRRAEIEGALFRGCSTKWLRLR